MLNKEKIKHNRPKWLQTREPDGESEAEEAHESFPKKSTTKMKHVIGRKFELSCDDRDK